MIQFLAVTVVVLLVGGILLLSGQWNMRKKTRDELKKMIEKFVDAKSLPIEGAAGDSYQIHFSYDGKACIYEDLEGVGFHDKIHKSFLKVPTPSKLTVQFTEKKRERAIGGGPMLASEMLNDAHRSPKPQLPKELTMFSVFTNDAAKVNELFGDWWVRRIFNEFKHIDRQGRPTSSLKIMNGVIILDFHTSGLAHPKSLDFEDNMAPLENYIKKLMRIRDKIESLD